MKNDSRIDVVVVSSLVTHPLNRHVANGLARAARSFPGLLSVRLVHPDMALTDLRWSEVLPDLVIYMGSPASGRMPVEQIGRAAADLSARSVFWSTEDPYEMDFAWRAEAYDLYVSNDANVAAAMVERMEGGLHLPLGACYEDLRPVRPPASERVFFCGAPYQNREIFVDDFWARAKATGGPDLFVAGNGWDRVGQRVVASPTSRQRLLELQRSAGLALYLHRSLNLANRTRRLSATTPGPRLFETAMLGVPQIMEFFSFEIETYFTPGEEILVARDGHEAADLARELLSDPARAAGMARAAQRRAVAAHSWEHRLAALVGAALPDRAGGLKDALADIVADRLRGLASDAEVPPAA